MTRLRLLSLGALALALPAGAGGASPIAEVICEDSARMQARLGSRYGPEPHATALRERGDQVMEVWRAPGGDWALVARYATGMSCLLAMGEAWQETGPRGAKG